MANENMTAELRFLPAHKARELLRTRQVSALEYVAALLDAIRHINPQLNAFLEFYPEQALAAAVQADQARARDESKGPLAGIPFAVKDLVDVCNRATTAQSRAFQGRVAEQDATVVSRMREAGAILIGKLSLEECGLGSPMDDLPWPPARNPWDPARTPGGSSGGCGAALAAGLVPFAIGTDTGGSVRNPAALCGVVGLKPTYERISKEGVLPLAPTLDHIGLMARTAADCSLLLECLDPNSCISSAPRVADRALQGYRVGWLKHLYLDEEPADGSTCAAIDAACAVLRDLGAEIGHVRVNNYRELLRCSRTILHFEAYTLHRLRLANAPDQYGERCRRALMRGAAIASSSYEDALSMRGQLSESLEHLLSSYDVLVTAVVTGPACRLDDEDGLQRSGQGALRIPFNLTGHPALALCVGFTEGGLPLAMQVIGRKYRDEAVLEIARAYQEATTWHRKRPSFETNFTGILSIERTTQ